MKTITLKKIRRVILLFIVLLVLSGIIAFPLVTEVDVMLGHINSFPVVFQPWIKTVYFSVHQTPDVVLYGTDWLAFAHLVIAVFFIGVYKDPVRNKFNVDAGLIACLAILPLAFICGPIRGIPFFHQVIDCSFGILGSIPLLYVRYSIARLERHSLLLLETEI